MERILTLVSAAALMSTALAAQECTHDTASVQARAHAAEIVFLGNLKTVEICDHDRPWNGEGRAFVDYCHSYEGQITVLEVWKGPERLQGATSFLVAPLPTDGGLELMAGGTYVVFMAPDWLLPVVSTPRVPADTANVFMRTGLLFVPVERCFPPIPGPFAAEELARLRYLVELGG